MSDPITEVAVILDRSGSMGRQRDATIEGFNKFIAELRKDKSTKCLVTLVQFDHEYQVNYLSKPIEEVDYLTQETYVPRGNTALHDAIGKTINGLTERHEALSDEDKPHQVMVVIMTDGHENDSQEFKGMAKEMIQSKDGWDFVYLGAGIDEIEIAKSYGLSANTVSSYDYSAKGIGSTYEASGQLLNRTRRRMSESDWMEQESARSLTKDVIKEELTSGINWKDEIVGSQSTVEEDDT